MNGIKLKAAIRAVLNEKPKSTGFTWGNIMTVWVILPIVVSITMMIYTENSIIGKPYLLFVPSGVLSMFVILTRKSVRLNKDFKI